MKIDPGDRNLYRNRMMAKDLIRSHIVMKETDLVIMSDRDISTLVKDEVMTQRDRLERYIATQPLFKTSLRPLAVPDTAPSIVKSMAYAAQIAGVGPMAAVAGAICEAVADAVGDEVRELILENGGDLYVATVKERVVGVFSGEETSGCSLSLRIRPEHTPLGICTSSGRLGHSLSLGDSAATTVMARSCALADAAATALGNLVRGKNGVRDVLTAARRIPGVLGVVVVRDGQVGVWGEAEIAELQGNA